MPTLTTEQQCLIFNCTPAQLRRQYDANLKIIKAMYQKAVDTGKKQGNMTADQLKANIDRFEKIIC